MRKGFLLFFSLALLVGILFLVGYTVLGTLGAAILVGFSFAYMLIIFLFTEKLYVKRLLKEYNYTQLSLLKEEETAKAILFSLLSETTSYRSISMNLPRVYFIAYPAPLALLLKSFFSPGTILISRHLVLNLNNSQLKELLRNILIQMNNPGLKIGTVFSFHAFQLFKLFPMRWRAMLFGNEQFFDAELLYYKSKISAIDLLPHGLWLLWVGPLWVVFKFLLLQAGRPIGLERRGLPKEYLDFRGRMESELQQHPFQLNIGMRPISMVDFCSHKIIWPLPYS